MTSQLLRVSIAAAAALTMAGGAAAATRHTHPAHPAQAMSGATRLMATLSGASGVPAGAPGATGKFTATINAAHTRLCYDLSVRGLPAPNAAHIHVGVAGQNGDPVVMLATPVGGKAKACMTVAASIGQKLAETPQGYYVNVHNAQFPGGGLRGQLAK